MTVIRYFPAQPTSHAPPYLSVVVPFFNEQAVLAACHQRILSVLDTLNARCEIIYVDDGSKDDSANIASALDAEHHDVTLIRLSRNFGKEAAMSAGLKATRGDAVILLDADLQDPPELIPEMIEAWQSGYDVVDMQRKARLGESAFKRFTARMFYTLLNRLSDVPIPENVGDFRLLDRRVVDTINALPERTRFMKGLFAWPGFQRTVLQFDRDPRFAGTTKWNTSQLFNLAAEGITSFSTKPLRLATYAGLMTGVSALCIAVVVVLKTLMWGDPVAGYPSLMLTVLTLGSVQLLSIGLLGEYLGRLFIEAKQRPLFLVDTQFTKAAATSSFNASTVKPASASNTAKASTSAVSEIPTP
ncbi:glycosyltransferase family 2 protein [Enterovibrio norvegicus]|uniref:Glycosyl transferase family 2 n=1 Tax=Enterovibrio norvegicus TaxID=188144 RepID=A0A2N7L952_9GAMM|nr:glycosyltransferase family 2 protein [Enterovibrio norvegicus]PMN72104.1 glycosyl transferase family 2 [Enterovibrio norvegicus]PMN90860.1 glycosyl transferase family 2 [Enterovibrio norvegicus]